MARLPRFDRLDDRQPHVRFLSNGTYTVAVTSAGSGYSTCRGQLLTNWVPDRTEDGLGAFLYLRDRDEGIAWSATHQPTRALPQSREAVAAPGSVRFARVDHGIETRLDICVAAARDAEIRRLVVTNRSDRQRSIEVTSYAEIVLAPFAAHQGHPAFSKLFVQTEYDAAGEALVASRRPRGRGEHRTWAAARLAGDGALEHETDRVRFIGRGRRLGAPAALAKTAPLSGTTGNVLDPIFSLRRIVSLAPGASARFVLVLAFGESREQALGAATIDVAAIDGELEAAAERERAIRKQSRIRDREAEALQELAGRVAYRDPELVAGIEPRPAAKAYLAALGLEAPSLVPPTESTPAKTPKRRARYRPLETASGEAEPPASVLRSENGYGGFSSDGREYVIRTDGTSRPPMPWINVMGNERFGFFASESGAANTWSGNSREHRLTPWSNDPVIDPHSEALYVRDEKARTYWSPLPGPASSGACEVRHAFGTTTWRQASGDLEQEVVAFVPRDASLKIVRLRLKNAARRSRRLSVFAYHQLVLGVLPWDEAPGVATEIDADAGAIFAQNEKSRDFAGRVAFAAAVASGAPVHATCDRMAFLGRNGSADRPAAVESDAVLDGRAGRGLDPCAAVQVELEVPARGEVECAFLLGEESSRDEALAAIVRYREPGAIDAALEAIRAFWLDVVGAVEVETPSAAIDLMVNGWLLYQCLVCRLWGRSAFYQSGGAFGFRDQLQDSASLVYCRPDVTRAQIVLHAAHQFVEGDVLHWWHPPAERGTRTRCSDDLLWLPYITAFYVHTTGDSSVLDEVAGYVTARALEPGEDETYLQASPADERSDVYEHCCRAIDRSLGLGAHGLPFMGTCDWNDGMNHVGREGRGESVWLGFFLYRLLEDFLPICDLRGDARRSARYRAHRETLHAALEGAGWDGEWYRRAYDDDGLPLGSAENDECKIDVLAQAWSVISGSASPERAKQAMAAAERDLVDRQAKLIRLLTPAFDKTERDPGYIKGYVPGIRENGGQYTHAATWAVRAFAELGRRDLAAALYEMITPVAHTSDRATADVYKVEPYVVVADIYGEPPHVGRGGWTWYTGSAGWMYRVALESVLGITVHQGNELRVKPCIPDDWPRFRVRYRLLDRKTVYDIDVENPHGKAEAVRSVSVDGVPGTVEDGAARFAVSLDGGAHSVKIALG